MEVKKILVKDWADRKTTEITFFKWKFPYIYTALDFISLFQKHKIIYSIGGKRRHKCSRTEEIFELSKTLISVNRC